MGELALWTALRSLCRQYRANQHPSRARAHVRKLIKLAAQQHWTVDQIADASTLSQSTIRKYIGK